MINMNLNHSGIVTGYDVNEQKVQTVEGNTTKDTTNNIGYAVMKKNRTIDYFDGFGDNYYTGKPLLNCALVSGIILNVLFKDDSIFKVINLAFGDAICNNDVFDTSKLPDGMFYRLDADYKYMLNDRKYLMVKKYENSEKIFYVHMNNHVITLGDEDYNPRTDASAYIMKNKGDIYLLIDKMHENDVRFYNLYHVVDDNIVLIETGYGRIDFVGYDYIIGYTDLGMIGYQRCEFKKVFRNGKFELDGEYKVVGRDNEYPFWYYYTLVKDLEYEEYNDRTKKYRKKVLKAGSKIRALSTDAKSYINIEVEDGRKGKVKVDKVEDGFGRDFFVNGQLFMNYYFLDGTKYDYEVFNALPAY